MSLEWMDQAACANGSGCLPEWWDRCSETGYVAGNRMALVICNQCAVKTQCGEQAVLEGAEAMIRGGMVFPADRYMGKPRKTLTGRSKDVAA